MVDDAGRCAQLLSSATTLRLAGRTGEALRAYRGAALLEPVVKLGTMLAPIGVASGDQAAGGRCAGPLRTRDRIMIHRLNLTVRTPR